MSNWFKDLMNKNNFNNEQNNYDKDKINSLLNECQERLDKSQQLIHELEHLVNDHKCNCCCDHADSNIKNTCKKFQNTINNPNIHLSKEEKMRIREEHLRKCNTPKPKYYYKGDEFIDTDYRTYVKIYWNDETTTKATCNKEDNFNFGYGLLLATVKKFVKKLDLDLLDYGIEKITDKNNIDAEVLKIYILELLVRNTAGSKCLQDIHKESQIRENNKQLYKLNDIISKYIIDHFKDRD